MYNKFMHLQLAFSSKAPFVPDPKKDELATRWIASLSDGSTVFEDIIPYERSAWNRLRDYCNFHSLKLTNLRLEAYNRRIILVPYFGDDHIPQLNGYWYSKRQNALFGVYSAQWIDIGIGFIKGKQIIITWVSPDGSVKQELRDYRFGDLATIINDNI